MKITDELKKSLESLSEDEVKRLLRRHFRAKQVEASKGVHDPKDVKRELVALGEIKDEIRYYVPLRQQEKVGREDYTGHTSLTDKMGYMPLLDRLLQMQRGGESLAQFRSYMAEYNVELRKEMEKAAKLHADEWPVALPTYLPDAAELQGMAREAQYRAAARIKVAREEAYRRKAMGMDPEKSSSSPGGSGASTEPKNQPVTAAE